MSSCRGVLAVAAEEHRTRRAVTAFDLELCIGLIEAVFCEVGEVFLDYLSCFKSCEDCEYGRGARLVYREERILVREFPVAGSGVA